MYSKYRVEDYELGLLRHLHYETFAMHGEPVIIESVKSSEREHGMDSNITLNKPIESYMVFEEHPKMVLKNMNWAFEHEDETVAYLPYEGMVVPLEKGTIITVVSPRLESPKKYIVTRVRGNSINIVFFILVIAPYRAKIEPNEEKTDYKFLNR